MEIDKLKGLVSRRRGFARTNRFEILVVPPAQAFDDLQEVRDLNILCDACSLPGRQMQTFETNYTRQQVKVVQSFINEDVSFTFNLTNDMFIKRVFDRWTNMIIDRTTFKKNYDSKYKRDIAIYQNDINTVSDILILPFISNFSSGEFLPIPTLPSAVILNFSVNVSFPSFVFNTI